MNFIPLSLSGAYEVQLEPRSDERGFFARMYCDEEFAAHGLNTNWPQINMSHSVEVGTLRGMHFQRSPHREVKLVRCLQGCVADFIVDLRSDSETFGEFLTVELSGDLRNAIYIPEGFAHGFQTLKSNSELQYFHSTPYAPSSEGGVNPLDPALGIDWPLEPRNLSERDTALPRLKDVPPL